MIDYCMPEKGRVALLTLSAQRDFGAKGSPVKASGLARALPAMRQVVEGFRAMGAPVFHAVRLYRADGSNVDNCRRRWIEEGSRFLMPGSFGSELLDELKPEPAVRLDPEHLLSGGFQEIAANEWAFYRPRWGAFHNTSLEQKLTELGITTLVICGLSSSTGTKATVYEASARDFRIILVPDAVSAVSEEALCELGRIGVYLVQSERFLPWMHAEEASQAMA
ncbi:MAG: isochorismatase family cysteine hydrolase [Pseudomonadota bacterium]